MVLAKELDKQLKISSFNTSIDVFSVSGSNLDGFGEGNEKLCPADPWEDPGTEFPADKLDLIESYK